MKNFGLISYIVLLLCLQTTISSQQTCPTFYTEANLQGDSFQMCSSGDVPSQWNDQALSVYVPPGYSVQLYQDSGFGGESLGSYTQGSYSVSSIGLSSVMVSSTQTLTQTQTSSQTCPTFYRDENQRGDSFQMCSSGNVPFEWNDQSMSFYVPSGYSIQLYRDISFGGQNLGSYTQGSYNVPTDGQLSSVIVSQSQSAVATTVAATNTTVNASTAMAVASPVNTNEAVVLPVNAPVAQTKPSVQSKPADIKCPTFYRDIDQQGDSFALCSSGNVPSSWNDQVSSFSVPPGYYVKLYSNRKYGGRNFGTYIQGFYNVPSNFNDQLSSILMIKR